MTAPAEAGAGVAPIPPLPHGCGSWICTSPNGMRREFYGRRNVGIAAIAGWKVETAIDYLHRINTETKAGAKTP